jgi:hypothetical protein
MRVHAAVFLLASLAAAQASADVYRVRNTNDSGTYSLRWAIEQANVHAGRDKIVFAARLSGKAILPASRLPDITDGQTIIDGDINDDGEPDIAINGKKLSSTGSGLVIFANRCVVRGLAIVFFPESGLYLWQANDCTIESCNIGVNLAGTRAVINGSSQLYLVRCHGTTIGGSSAIQRNVIATAQYDIGLAMEDCSETTISGNYFGLARDGLAALDGAGIAISLVGVSGPCQNNVIGGTTAGERNVFGGLTQAISFRATHSNTIAGNYFGLLPNGNTSVSVADYGITFIDGCTDNTVGGTVAGARNVFAGGMSCGVFFSGSGTEDNRVQGNYFGLNAAGTQQRRLEKCVSIVGGAGRQVIGGGTSKAANYFTPKSPDLTFGVIVSLGGAGTLIQRNLFGVLPNGKNATQTVAAVDIVAVSPLVTDNTFVGAECGIALSKAGTNPRVFRNTFRACDTGVYIENDASCRLGNLSNPSTADDGGNTFRNSNTWHIRNFTGNRITAEGNRFGTTSRAAIDAKIHDRRDDPSKGRVDYNPLAGGVIPTGETVSLTVGSATALPTAAGGAEIAFSLSAPANVTVTVLNIAGRPVAAVLRGSATDAGLQRVVWSGRSDHGTPAPNGTYLVRIVARDEDGQQAQSLGALRLGQ